MAVILTTITIMVFAIAYPISAAIAVVLIGPVGLLSAVFSVLQLARTLTSLLAMITYLPYVQGAVFDAVLSKEGKDDLVSQWKAQQRNKKRTYSLIRAQLVTFVRFVRFRGIPFIFREIAYFILGLIPILGFSVVLYFKASRKGHRTHRRYYELMGWNQNQIARFYKLHKGEYTMFGVVALIFEMIPGLNVFFMFTNNIGLALWTVKKHEEFSTQMKLTHLGSE